MANGIYIGMSGAVAREKQLSVVANNLANANTTGFKEIRPQFGEFLMEAARGRPADKGFTAVTSTTVDDSAGSLTPTGNPLDVAIDGPGYFLVAGPDGPLATRAGSFQLGADGTLLDGSGLPVLSGDPSAAVPITASPNGGTVSITSDGQVMQAGTPLATLTVVTSNELTPRGDAHYGIDMGSATAAPPRLVTETLEGSNVNVVRKMVELIEVTRAFETQQRLMTQYREADRKAMDVAG